MVQISDNDRVRITNDVSVLTNVPQKYQKYYKMEIYKIMIKESM